MSTNFPLPTLQDTLHQNRIAKNKDFKLIEENATRLKSESDRTVYSLNLDNYLSMIKNQKKELKKFEKLMKETTGIELSSLPSDAETLKVDTAKAERTERMIEDLGKDIYLAEAVMVMEDIFKGNR